MQLFPPCNSIFQSNWIQSLEIGAGTGMYLEKVIDLYSPRTYEVYETAIDWVAILKHNTYREPV